MKISGQTSMWRECFLDSYRGHASFFNFVGTSRRYFQDIRVSNGNAIRPELIFA